MTFKYNPFKQGYQVYTPEEVYITLADEYPLTDWVSVSINRDEDNASIYKAPGRGKARVIKRADTVYMMELTIPDQSPDNAFIQSLIETEGLFNVNVTDATSNGDVFVGKTCYVLSEGTFEKSGEASECVYMIGVCYGKRIKAGARLETA